MEVLKYPKYLDSHVSTATVPQPAEDFSKWSSESEAQRRDEGPYLESFSLRGSSVGPSIPLRKVGEAGGLSSQLQAVCSERFGSLYRRTSPYLSPSAPIKRVRDQEISSCLQTRVSASGLLLFAAFAHISNMTEWLCFSLVEFVCV
jgi:hypothetical protein